MSEIKIKVCGITTLEDARLAVELGASMLGFNFYSGSSRYIEPRAAGSIVAGLPPEVEAVGVFVNATLEEIADAVTASGVRAAQLHGDEEMSFCEELRARMRGIRLIKALHTGPGLDVEVALRYRADAILIDAPCASFGGSGLQADWEQVRAVAVRVPGTILAGGLTPANVAEAVLRARPHAVDVCSGVEAGKGRKDAVKMRSFFSAVRGLSAPGEAVAIGGDGSVRDGGQR